MELGPGALQGEQRGPPSCGAVCCSCFVCRGVCVVAACALGPGLSSASGWVLQTPGEDHGFV